MMKDLLKSSSNCTVVIRRRSLKSNSVWNMVVHGNPRVDNICHTHRCLSQLILFAVMLHNRMPQNTFICFYNEEMARQNAFKGLTSMPSISWMNL